MDEARRCEQPPCPFNLPAPPHAVTPGTRWTSPSAGEAFSLAGKPPVLPSKGHGGAASTMLPPPCPVRGSVRRRRFP